MLPFVLGGVALAATGYGIKKFFEDDDNRDKVEDALIRGYDWIDEVDRKAEVFFDGLIEKLDTNEDKEFISPLLKKLSLAKYETSKHIHNEIENILHNLLINFSEEEKSSTTKLFDTNRLPLQSTEENLCIVDEFCDILKNAKTYASQKILELKDPLIQTNDFTKLDQNIQEKIKNLSDFKNLLDDADKCPITFDGVTISQAAKICFERINLATEELKK